jgi:pimeloyl-ACP methyl ester carboxylesterase
VSGLQLYYEIHGPAHPPQPPLVLLHGGGDTIETSFGRLLPVLARTRRVVAFEQQGFGHTADIAERSFSFTQSADDTAALLEYLHLGPADLLGFSNGGTIALQVAIQLSRLVRKLVVASTLFSRAGCFPAFWAGMEKARPEMMPKELHAAYLRVAPHPENFESFFYKCAHRMRDFEDIAEDFLRGVAAPTLVLNGDADVSKPEHAVALFRLLPHAQIAILPGTDHMAMMTRTDWLGPMIGAFLEAAPAK